MSKRRIFIAIACSEEVRGMVAAYQERWRFLPVRWIAPQNLHLTLLPPIYLTDDEIARFIGTLQDAIPRIQRFGILFGRFAAAPPEKPERMIWLLGEPQPALTGLRDAAGRVFPSRSERRGLIPHITIARMHPGEWKRYSPKPDITEPAEVKMPVTAVAVMESVLHRGGAEYSTLELIPLADNA